MGIEEKHGPVLAHDFHVVNEICDALIFLHFFLHYFLHVQICDLKFEIKICEPKKFREKGRAG